MPVQWEIAPWYIREKYMDLHYNYQNFTWFPVPHEDANDTTIRDQRSLNVDSILRFLKVVNETTCKWFRPQDLVLNGDVGYGAEQQYENEALMAG